MNLVQINERLKDLPMQVVQQYANGMNPEVPPYLALGELQRRELSQKQMATAQGAQQGPQPSVKEQVEQKAGLMALQQMQQQQVAQQMAQPRGPMPVPAGVPQPEDQPEVAMARGGLAGIPVRSDMFEYAGGGIVAFSGEDERVKSVVPEAEVARILKKSPFNRTPEENATLERSGQKLQRRAIPEDSAVRRADRSIKEAGPEIRSRLTDGASGLSDEELANLPAAGGALNERILRAIGVGPSAPPAAAPVAISRPTERMTPQQMEARMAPAGLPAAAADKGVAPPAAAPRVATTGAPRPAVMAAAPAATPQAGLPAAAQSANPYEARLNELALRQPVEPTTQSAISRVSELSPAAMQEAALQKRNQEMRDRAAAYREQFEKGRPSGLDDLIRVFGQAGQFKGLSGVGPAYTANQQQKRAEELAMEKQYNELMNLADKSEFEGGKELFGARTEADKLNRQLFGKEKESALKATSDLYGGTQRSLDEAANRLNLLEIEKLRVAERRAERNQPGSAAMVRAEYLTMMDKVFDLERQGKTAEAEALRKRADARLTASTGANTGAGRNAIMERRQTMAELDKIMKDEGMVYSDAEKAEAAKEYRRLAMQNVKEGGDGGGSAIPDAAVQALRKNPALAAQFDQKYGKGAAAQYLQK